MAETQSPGISSTPPQCWHGRSLLGCDEPEICTVVGCCVWDIEHGMTSWLGDNSEAGWHILGAVLNPGHIWGKAALLLGSGFNGKSTFIRLARNLVAPSESTSVSLDQLATAWGPEAIIGKKLVASDCSDNVCDSEALRAITGHTPLRIHRKHRGEIEHRPQMFAIFAVNELNGSAQETQLLSEQFHLLPFPYYYAGSDIPEISQEFVHRKDVLEYVTWRSRWSIAAERESLSRLD